MATKDWKIYDKLADIRIRWKNKKTDKMIFIVQYSGYKDWSFSDYSTKGTIHGLTKSQALKFAKSYMRTH